MNRRACLMTLASAAVFVVGCNKLNILSTLPHLARYFQSSRKTKYIQSGEIYIAEADTIVCMPKSARDGDIVHIVIDKNSLHSPCIVKYRSGKVAGAREPLVLDSLAILKFEYQSTPNDWRIV
jgi:hypothetical protein